MTRNAPEPDSRDVGDADFHDAELEDIEDDEERERQKARSAIVGLVALIIVVVLAGIGLWTSIGAVSAPPDPGISRQVSPAPAP